jgi:hypothetical protein
MSEKAFIVKPGSELYKLYFDAREEKLKFNDLALAFLKKHNFCESMTVGMSPIFRAKMTAEEREIYAPQVKKATVNGLTEFKRKSVAQACWTEEVASNVNFDLIDKFKFWFLGFIYSGSYNMWHHGKAVYGYLSNRNGENIELSADMVEIKMSEYYKAMEEVEAEQEENND